MQLALSLGPRDLIPQGNSKNITVPPLVYLYDARKILVLPALCRVVRNIVAKFKTLGLSMWSLALHGTFLDGLADIMEEIRALETLGLSFEMFWVMLILFFTN